MPWIERGQGRKRSSEWLSRIYIYVGIYLLFTFVNIFRKEFDQIDPLDISNTTKNEIYSHLKSACESGWDFSTRWFVVEGSEIEGGVLNAVFLTVAAEPGRHCPPQKFSKIVLISPSSPNLPNVYF